MNGKKYDFESFYNLITPYIEEDKKAYEQHSFPRNGTGCWHPTFPGRSDDIWIAASTYEQRYEDNVFQGFLMVDKDG